MKAFQTPSKTPSKTDTSPSPSSLLSSSSTPRSLRFREDSIPESLSSSLPEDSPSALQRLLRVRGSPVAASRYHRWVVTERNFGSGQEVRDVLEHSRAERHENSERHRAKGASLLQDARARSATNKAVSEHTREQNLEKAHKVKAETQDFKNIGQRQKEEWRQRGRELVAQEQESAMKVEERETQRVAKLAYVQKRQELKQKVTTQLVRAELQKRAAAVASAVRASTSDAVLDDAKQTCLSARKELVESTRAAQQSGREERRQEAAAHVAKARANRAAIEAAKKKAKELKEQVAEQRRAEGIAAKEQVRREKEERAREVLNGEGGIRQKHDSVYRQRYATGREVEEMMLGESSSVVSLS
jgi:hypothetical protein